MEMFDVDIAWDEENTGLYVTAWTGMAAGAPGITRARGAAIAGALRAD